MPTYDNIIEIWADGVLRHARPRHAITRNVTSKRQRIESPLREWKIIDLILEYVDIIDCPSGKSKCHAMPKSSIEFKRYKKLMKNFSILLLLHVNSRPRTPILCNEQQLITVAWCRSITRLISQNFHKSPKIKIASGYFIYRHTFNSLLDRSKRHAGRACYAPLFIIIIENIAAKD